MLYNSLALRLKQISEKLSEAPVSHTVLVVDNEAELVNLLHEVLEKTGYTVIDCISGQHALEIIDQSIHPGGQQIDLVLLDIMMSDVSGIDICRAIRANEALEHLPVMMLTALAEINDRLDAFEAGADDYLIKPINLRELLARVQVQLRLRSAERDARRRTRELSALRTVSETLSHSPDDINTMLKNSLAVTCDVLRIDAGLIYLVEDNPQFMSLVVSRGVSEDFALHPDVIRRETAITAHGQILPSDKAIAIEDIASVLKQSRANIRDEIAGEGIASAAFIPIKAEGIVTGVLIVASRKTRVFHAEEIALLETIGAQLGVAIIRTSLHQEARNARDRAQTLARQMVKVQEDERRRIAHELHDQLGQDMTALKLDLELLRDDLSPEHAHFSARLTEDIAMASHMLKEIQTLSLNLRPAILDDLGLMPALHWYLDQYAKRTGLTVDIIGLAEDSNRMPEEVETIAFRCVQEILTNIARHANAQHVHIALDTIDGQLRISASDDGVGFSTSEILGPNALYTSMGISGMQERASLLGGHVEITSVPGAGTEAIVNLPLGVTQS